MSWQQVRPHTSLQPINYHNLPLPGEAGERRLGKLSQFHATPPDWDTFKEALFRDYPDAWNA